MRTRRALVVLLMTVVPGAPAAAQDTTAAQTSTPPTAQIATPIDPAVLKGMFPVYVVEKSGDEIAGKLVSLTTTDVVVQTDAATRTFALSDVAQVYRKGDSLKNGAIIGAIFGLATGIIVGLECTGNDTPDSCGAGTRATLIVTSTAAWSAIGVAIDALIPGRTLIWKAGR